MEITKKVIKAAEISRYQTNKPKLIKYAEVILPDGVASDSEIYDADFVAEALKDLWREVGFSTKQVALGLSSRRYMIKRHTMPMVSLEKMRQTLALEVDDILPTQWDDPILDFYPTETNEENREMSGMVIAAPTEAVEKIVSVLKSASLVLEHVDFTPFACVRAVRRFIGDSEESLIINVGATNSEIIVVKNGVPKVVRIIPHGVHIRKMKSKAEIEAEKQAKEKQKEKADQPFADDSETDPEADEEENQEDSENTTEEEDQPVEEEIEEVEDINSEDTEQLLTDIRNTAEFYQKGGGEISNIYLIGEGSLSQQLQDRIVPDVRIPTQRIELDQVINRPLKMNEEDTSKILEASIVSTVGLGMMGLKK